MFCFFQSNLDGSVCDFSVDHSSVKKDDILNINQHLMNKKSIRRSLDLSKKYLSDY